MLVVAECRMIRFPNRMASKGGTHEVGWNCRATRRKSVFWSGFERLQTRDFECSGCAVSRVDSNSRVQIRFKAPDASKVRVNFWSGPKADMEKQPDGFWTFTTPAMAPGLHYYTIIVDGAEVSDPGSTAYFGGNKWASAVEVPEAGADYYVPRTFRTGRCARSGTTPA